MKRSLRGYKLKKKEKVEEKDKNLATNQNKAQAEYELPTRS